jgi:hypothetical protein
MNKKDEEIVLEQQPIINGNMIDLLGKVKNFNDDYVSFLKNQLDIAKKQQLEEMETGG